MCCILRGSHSVRSFPLSLPLSRSIVLVFLSVPASLTSFELLIWGGGPAIILLPPPPARPPTSTSRLACAVHFVNFFVIPMHHSLFLVPRCSFFKCLQPLQLLIIILLAHFADLSKAAVARKTTYAHSKELCSKQEQEGTVTFDLSKTLYSYN